MTIVTSGPEVRPAMLDDIRRLVECESPSSDHAAIARSADVVAGIGAGLLGSDPERIVLDGVTHLRWRLGGPTKVLVLAHHDTVWPLGSLATHPFVVEDGIVRGPGCFDMKCGLAMALHAIASLPSHEGITLLVTGDEEVGSATSRALIESEAAAARAALVLEASADGGALKLARKGVSTYEVHIAGRAAHAGLEPERGANAAVELAYQVLAIAALGDPDAGTTVTPTVLSAGTTVNTVPSSAVVFVDSRAWTTTEQDRVDAGIRSSMSHVQGAALEVRGGPNRPPLERSASAELFASAQAVAADLGMAPLTSAEVGGGSDGNFTAGVGIPTLDGLGAVGGGAHADHEHVVVSELEPRTRLLAGLISRILEADRP
ncbi:M20 family metallopeptidase [Microbacterium deminutum]|uniref:M20 family metallopeptidase n=1 Tax=Microbacterium deminutum TaxID=344164 RepID=A0ABN2RAQ2_9MICO